MRLSTDVNSTCQEQKDFFWNRFSEIRKLLNQPGSRLIDNFSLLGTLFDLVSESLCLNLTLLPLHLSHTQPPFLTLLPLSLSQPSLFCPIVVSLVDVAKKWNELLRLYIDVYIGFPSSKEGELFVAVSHCFSALIEGLASPCPCVARNLGKSNLLLKYFIYSY